MAVTRADSAVRVVACEDLVTGLAGDAELSAQRRHLLSIQQPGNELQSFVHGFTHLPGHLALPAKGPNCVTHVSGMNCHPSLRKGMNDLARPQAATITHE